MMQVEQVLDLLRPEIRALKAYDNLRGSTSSTATILDSNENVISATPALTAAQRHRYPQIKPRQLIERLASLYQVKPKQIMLGRGSDDIIDVIIRAFCSAEQDSILQTTPCFSMYGISAHIQGASVRNVALREDKGFRYQVDEIIAELGSHAHSVKCVFLASPQSPTGQLLARADLEKLLTVATKQVVVVDEAYIEFSDALSASELIEAYPNLIVMRTLSKAYGLANLRCGAMLANAKVVTALRPVLTPYALSGLVVETAYQALEKGNVQKIIEFNQTLAARRAQLLKCLEACTFIQGIYSTETNFILCKTNAASKIVQFLESNDVYIRSYSDKSVLSECIRITIGSEADIKILTELFNQFEDTSTE